MFSLFNSGIPKSEYAAYKWVDFSYLPPGKLKQLKLLVKKDQQLKDICIFDGSEALIAIAFSVPKSASQIQVCKSENEGSLEAYVDLLNTLKGLAND